jgi:hypothetical protein
VAVHAVAVGAEEDRTCRPLTDVEVDDPGGPWGLADAWRYPYTDFGEGQDQDAGLVLRAARPVSLAAPIILSAIIATGVPGLTGR